ncbi:hypothetical protein LJC17_04290 [Acholeplasma sp. OttesenSCG-928-E16]|nr:hypothetical protein [Acholeplasma sp. OttesenSCG-928-E16]
MKVLKNFASLIVMGLGVIALIVFLSAPAVSLTGKVTDTITNYNGWQVAFGYTSTNTVLGVSVDVEVLKASALAIIALVLVVGGVVMALLSMGKKPKRLFILIGVVAFVGAAILMFLSAQGISFVEKRESIESLYKIALGAGSIIAGILNAVAAFFMLLKML